MVKSLLIAGFAGAALLTSLAAQAQTPVVAPKTQLPSTGSAFAIKNGGAFANQGGIANQAGRPGAGLIGNDGGSFVGKSGAGILSHTEASRGRAELLSDDVETGSWWTLRHNRNREQGPIAVRSGPAPGLTLVLDASACMPAWSIAVRATRQRANSR